MDKRLLLGGLIFVLVMGVVLFIRLSGFGSNDLSTQNQQVNQQTVLGSPCDENKDCRSGYECNDSYCKLEDGATNPSTTIQPSKSNGNTISLETLSTHNSANDCWIAFEGKVYDITSWIPKHPGGEDKIIPNCGSSTKFEQAFTTQHGRSKVQLLMDVGTFIGDFDIVGNL